jgi:arginase family enzyme
MHDLSAFFSPLPYIETIDKEAFHPLQWGAHVKALTSEDFDWEEADIVIVGCGESRGANANFSDAPNTIRKYFYELFVWHPQLKVVDVGNILEGATEADTKAALALVLKELEAAGKTVLVLGGSQDLTLEQYNAFRAAHKTIQAVAVDMLIDLEETTVVNDRSYLMNMLTEDPNFIQHFTHIGFQSYFVQPQMLQTLDMLRFDCLRLGKVRSQLSIVEPPMRDAHLLTVDMNAVKYSDAPINKNGSPNGFAGDEMCQLMKYAGMSQHLQSIGLYGYDPTLDQEDMTARLMAQMLWYFIDGFSWRAQEASLSDTASFLSFHVQMQHQDTLFMKSKKTNRWWMQLPDASMVPCTYEDYLCACNDEIPDRWLRIQERLS